MAREPTAAKPPQQHQQQHRANGESIETLAPSRLRYTTTKPLGRGSFGDVYHGTLDDCSCVAVKLLRAGNAIAARQFRRELRRYAQLRGVTGVVHFYGASKTNEKTTDVLVTELMAGGSLRNTLSSGRIDPPHALVIAEMVANALASIHKRGFSHGDVSASNVLLSRPLSDADNDQGLDMPPACRPGPEPARAKLVDFGLSRDVRKKNRNAPSNENSDDEVDSPNTLAYNQSGNSPPEPLGTPAYLAPEAWRGRNALRKSKVALAADVYALGILIYELESGEQPWVGMTEWAIFGAVYHGQKRPIWPELNPTSMPGLRKLAEKCWAHDYTERPTAREVALEIRSLRRSVGIATPPGTAVPSSPETSLPIVALAKNSRAQVDQALQAMRLLGARSDSDSDPGEKMLQQADENGVGEALLERSHNGGDLIGLDFRKQGQSTYLQKSPVVFSEGTAEPSADKQSSTGDMDVLEQHMKAPHNDVNTGAAGGTNSVTYEQPQHETDSYVDVTTLSLEQGEQMQRDMLTKSSNVNEEDRVIPQQHQTLPNIDDLHLHNQEIAHHNPKKSEPTDMERAQNVILALVEPEGHSSPLRITQTPKSPASSSGHSSESQSSIPSSVPSSAFRRARKKTPANMRFVGCPRNAAQAAADIELMQPLSPLRVPTAPPHSNTLPKLKPLRTSIRQTSLPAGAERGAQVEAAVGQVQKLQSDTAVNMPDTVVSQEVPEMLARAALPPRPPPPPQERQTPVQPATQQEHVEIMERTRSEIEMEKDLKYEAEMREEMERAEELRKQREVEMRARVQQQQHMQRNVQQAPPLPKQQPLQNGVSQVPHIRHPVPEQPGPQIRHPVVEPNVQQQQQPAYHYVPQPIHNAPPPPPPQEQVADPDITFREAPIGNPDDESEVYSTSMPRSRKSLEKDYPFKTEVHNNDVNSVIYALDRATSAADAASALRALAVLCGIDDGNRILAVRGSALELAAVALARHGRLHPAACRAMCELVLQLARAHNAEVERELRNTAACEHVLNALRWHPTARGVQQAAAMALAALCRSSGALAAIVVAQNGAHAATRALARATNARDGPDGPAAVGALDAIAALSAAHAESVVRARVLTDVVVAVQRLASPAIDAAAAGVIHACARSDAGRKAMLEDGAVIAALATLMTRARAAPDAARILALGCDAFAELAYAGGPPAADALTGGPVLESVLMSLHVLDGAQPFHAGTVLAVRALVCLRRFAELGVDTCAELHASHALQAAIDVVNARPENQDVAIGAAQFVAVIVGSLAKGPTRGNVQGADAALDMLRGLDETWLLDLRVLEVVRGAINIVENALGGRTSRVHTSDATVKMATARPGPKRLFRRKKRK